MAFGNLLRTTWRSGEATYGAWLLLPDPVGAELITASGMDFVCIDLQHGLMGDAVALSMVQAVAASGASPLIRVVRNDPAVIGRALDLGAHGVIVPNVDTPEQAAAAVAACRYPPGGVRSYGPVRTPVALGPSLAELDDVACVVMIESAQAVAAAVNIAATPGVDAMYVGPSDLGLSLGFGPQVAADDPRLRTALGAVRTAGDRAGIPVGIHAVAGRTAARLRAAGFRLVTVASDAELLIAGSALALRTARGLSDVGPVRL
jgi:4-hydroxy-2-oxoheptanedioate aldolase